MTHAEIKAAVEEHGCAVERVTHTKRPLRCADEWIVQAMPTDDYLENSKRLLAALTTAFPQAQTNVWPSTGYGWRVIGAIRFQS